MNKKWILIIILLICAVVLVYGLTGKPHEFLTGDCIICHIDVINDPTYLRPTMNRSCPNCHKNLEDTQSHPTDIYPSFPIPEDMPLIDGMLTCITCHYVHPKKKRQLVEKHYFLRRLVRGPLFCSICHDIDNKGHLVSGKLHTGTYKVTDWTSRIDRISLECIECHDTYINEKSDFDGVGIWDHRGSKLSHPIGVTMTGMGMKKIKDYRPANMLPEEVKLFDGKVGCGTCHSIYSKKKNMLVMDNRGSKLCLECHIK